MVLVDPQQQLGIHRVPAVDDPVSVAAIFRLVEFRQSQITVRVCSRGLIGKVAKQFLAAVDHAVVVAVQREEGIARVRAGPGDLYQMSVSPDIEYHASIRWG